MNRDHMFGLLTDLLDGANRIDSAVQAGKRTRVLQACARAQRGRTEILRRWVSEVRSAGKRTMCHLCAWPSPCCDQLVMAHRFEGTSIALFLQVIDGGKEALKRVIEQGKRQQKHLSGFWKEVMQALAEETKKEMKEVGEGRMGMGEEADQIQDRYLMSWFERAEPCALLNASGKCLVYGVHPTGCLFHHTISDPKVCRHGYPQDEKPVGVVSWDRELLQVLEIELSFLEEIGWAGLDEMIDTPDRLFLPLGLAVQEGLRLLGFPEPQ